MRHRKFTPSFGVRRLRIAVVALSVVSALPPFSAFAQSVDCARLRQQIALGDETRGAPSRRQANELARTQTISQQLGCDGFSFFGGDPRCAGLTSRIAQLQANLAQRQAGGGRGDLVARFNAYCRAAPAPRERGFFDQLFGGVAPPPPPQAQPSEAQLEPRDDGDEAPHGRGGSQAVCVRSCDGGFFPLPLSARHRAEDLTQMCQALCPGVDTAVFTRNPDSDIKMSVSLDGKPYADLENALAFQKRYTPSCSCRQPGRSWAETLANAEEVLANKRRGDIVVTAEKAAELSRPKSSPALPAAQPAPPQPRAANIEDASPKPAIRQVGPQP